MMKTFEVTLATTEISCNEVEAEDIEEATKLVEQGFTDNWQTKDANARIVEIKEVK